MHKLSTQKSSGDGLSHYRVKNHMGVEEKELLRSCQRVSWVFPLPNGGGFFERWHSPGWSLGQSYGGDFGVAGDETKPSDKEVK